MESKNRRKSVKSKSKEIPSAPPGFRSLTSFMLKKVAKTDKSECDPICMESILKLNDAAAYRAILKHRPWILFDHSNCDPEKSNTEDFPQGFSSNACRPKGVSLGCPDCNDCLKVTARWCPEDARRDVLDEVQMFHPTEEEFKDTLEYIASIRSKAEPYGICRIVPPPSWQPPCLPDEKNIWENSKFSTKIQRIDGLQVQCQQEVIDNPYKNVETKTRKEPGAALDSQPGNENPHDVKDLESKPGPTFSLSTFKKFADDFKAKYFHRDNNVMGSDEKWEPSVENVEGEYGRITQNPTDEIEVVFGNDLGTGVLSSGFPMVSDSVESLNHPECMRSGWNLNNMLTQAGSLLSFESSEVSSKFAPQVHVGMCFSSFNWKVEEHQLYSLCYMHVGEPRVWYSIPGRFAADFETVRKKHLPILFAEESDLLDNLQMQLSSAILKSEGVPVYRCVQYPREFVLVFPGAYHSGFDCGFNFSESVSFAPLDWLLHGQKVVELYCEQRRRTSISYDKLLLGAARKAVRAQFEIGLCGMGTPDNLYWKDACGRDGILTKAFDLRRKSESSKREFLCASLKSRIMEKDFDVTCKRECCVCLRDLHLSAISCPCSTNKFACLNHGKQLCFCPWSDKFILWRYEISELNTLCLALEGKASVIHKWAKVDLGLTVHSVASKASKQNPGNASASSSTALARVAFLNSLKRKRDAVEPKGSGTDGISPSIEAKLKPPLPDSTCVGKSKAKQKKVGHQSTARHKSGVNSAPAIKPDLKSRKVQSSIPNLAENDPKVSRDFLGLSLTSGYVSLLPEIRSFDVSSDSSASSSGSDDDT
ncbi:putative lysine-specific demethylase JMJ16 isoform X3 [Prosopis cineraria]|nr:putative lysine-specific demethylase JMJ16 isoform X3 [Prosopis cineraria]XP_054815393.1 putative lysine-specific demethylase JMJ16 isoform X3 [Prosopis cineraria]